jgi:hypothetical protein
MRKKMGRLSLSTETLRVLADGNLKVIRGGLYYSYPQTECCTQGASAVACCEPTDSSNQFTDCC